ncbi:viomycin phosphotransferase [Pseudonocardia sp. HH130630-07]|uniref:viomycin phosphotransferase n=1 Tax=Pseudonocardia sp. HH130630-07 TaxID=1690815 RepID=UPI000814E914|nr:viomycin phosphotransferase [Pseudonocardia sp. HH130630-07]ANY10654.1 phosphotransferase [Pseudonocardia sp. HH130630-07]
MDIIDTHRDLLGRLLPVDAPDELVVHKGQFHHVVIGSTRVVCFARTAASAVRLPERASVLDTLSGIELGFRTPQPLAAGGAQGTEEPPYLVLTRVPGAPLRQDAVGRPEVARQCVTLLSRLAAAGAEEKVRAVLPEAPVDEWRRFAAGVRAELFGLMSDGGRERAERELVALEDLPHVTSAVVHGDLGSENVLWETSDGALRLSGVVDWDDVGIGDPAEDLAAIGASYGDEALDRVLTLGGWAGDGIPERIATIRGTFALQQALYALRDGDDEQLADGLTGYR